MEEIIFKGNRICVRAVVARNIPGAVLEVDNPDSPVRVITFNALREFAAALQAVSARTGLKFLVCRDAPGGAPVKTYAGADVNSFSGNADGVSVRRYIRAGVDLDFQFKNMPRKIITISFLRGERYGGAVEWPLMTRYSLCTPDCGIRFSEVNIGLIPGWNGILNTIVRAGKDNAFYLTATGDRIGADGMLACGLVSRVVPEASVLDAAAELALNPEPPREKRDLQVRQQVDDLIVTRMNAETYQNLRDVVRLKLETGELDSRAGSDRSAASYVSRELARLGRPLAPLAVRAVRGLTDEIPPGIADDPVQYEVCADREAELFCRLMDTRDRRAGVLSVLTHDALEKIPVFTGR